MAKPLAVGDCLIWGSKTRMGTLVVKHEPLQERRQHRHLRHIPLDEPTTIWQSTRKSVKSSEDISNILLQSRLRLLSDPIRRIAYPLEVPIREGTDYVHMRQENKENQERL
jgi:hypothetical protein